MSSIRQIVVSALVFAVVPTTAVRGSSFKPDKVEYVGGTVQSIPANSAGSFDFDDAKELQFSYSGTVLKVPYEQITGTEISEAEWRRMFHVPVPPLVPSHRKEILSINYKDSEGAKQTLNFELPANDALQARQTIKDKRAPQQPVATNPNDYWGDKYWKTARNKAMWDARNVQNAQNAQSAQAGGTK
jgi:hypothetical protein